MLAKKSLSLLAFSLLVVSDYSFAHAEHDKARFVAKNGRDVGHCNNPVRPCKTISYAVTKANKGDKVLVASGEYALANESDLFYLTSELVPILGGYNRFDHFQVQNPDVNKTTIVGVPHSYREQLHQKGFKVLADHKSVAISASLKQKLAKYEQLSQAQSNIACSNGSASGFPCQNVDLLAHVPLPGASAGNDIWGHVDLNDNSEYAIMGFSDGTRVYNVTNPTEPTLVGHISGPSTTWRDIKVLQYYDDTLNAYQAYAYITSEANGSGIQIIDLNNLPFSISLATTSQRESAAHNVYISNVDYSLNLPLNDHKPQLQIVGSRSFGGAFTSFSLDNPIDIQRSYSPISSNRSNYTHDATSLVVDDERANRDCQTSTEYCHVFIDFNEDEIRLWNTSDASTSNQLGAVGYNDVDKEFQYIHSGWWHENKQYVYVHDEWDERFGGLNTTVRILDIADLNNPTVVGKWVSDNQSIDHNGFVRGNRYYISNYERGLTILDISNPTEPQEVGYFDTFPTSNSSTYSGAWGVYPYLPSGNILISDIQSGLYILKDNTRDNTTQIAFNDTSVLIERGEQIALEVKKPAAVDQEVSVDFEVLNGKAKLGAAFTLGNDSKTLTWRANETDSKFINLTILDDNDTFKSSFFVKLTNPSPNANLGDANIAQININGESSKGLAGFIRSSLQVGENDNQFEVELSRAGGSFGSLTVNYSTEFIDADTSDVVPPSGTITWADGDVTNRTLVVTILDDDQFESTEQFKIKLTSDDNLVASSQSEIIVSILDDDTNQAPMVDLGNDIEIATNVAHTLTPLSVTDDQQDQKTYSWQQTAGPSVQLSNTNTNAMTLQSGQVSAELTFELTVTDSLGAAGTDTINVTVVAPPAPDPDPEPQPEPAKSSSSGALGGLLFMLIAAVRIRRIR